MLGVSAVGPRDDFFALGGDSLLAAELQIEIELAFGVEVPATTLFRTPTIADLAQVVESATGSAAMRADR
jgi:acyl carrier protein